MLQCSGLWMAMFLWCGCWVVCVNIMLWAPPFLNIDCMSKWITTWSQVCIHRRTKDGRELVGGSHPLTPTQGSVWARVLRISLSLPSISGHNPFISIKSKVYYIPPTIPVCCLGLPPAVWDLLPGRCFLSFGWFCLSVLMSLSLVLPAIHAGNVQ